MSSAIPASSAASHASSIVSHGAATTMLEKMSPVNSFPSCSTVPMLRRKLATSSVSMSRPSYSTAPFCGFSNPSRSLMSVDFPQPVLPTTPTDWPGRIFSDRSSSTAGAPSA